MKSPPRVLHVLEATLGGTGRHVLDLLRGLALKPEYPIELHLAFATRRSDQRFINGLPGLAEAGVHCFRCDMRRGIHPPSDMACLAQISRYAHRHGIQLVHGHSAKGGYLARLASGLLPRVRSVYTPHSSPFRMGVMYHGLEIAAGALLTDRVIAVSASERAELIQSHAAAPWRIRVIPNGLPEGSVDAQPVSKNGIVVGTLGRLTAQKSPLRFLDIAQRVVRQDPRIKFLWVGDGELRSQWQSWVREHNLEDNVQLGGWREDVETALAGMDIFLIVSDYEGAPYALLEAMRARLPCIVTDVPGSRDIVTHDLTGFIVPKEDRSQQVSRILALADDAALRHRFGEAGWNRWKHTYSLEHMVEATYEVYAELVPFNH